MKKLLTRVFKKCWPLFAIFFIITFFIYQTNAASCNGYIFGINLKKNELPIISSAENSTNVVIVEDGTVKINDSTYKFNVKNKAQSLQSRILFAR